MLKYKILYKNWLHDSKDYSLHIVDINNWRLEGLEGLKTSLEGIVIRPKRWWFGLRGGHGH